MIFMSTELRRSVERSTIQLNTHSVIPQGPAIDNALLPYLPGLSAMSVLSCPCPCPAQSMATVGRHGADSAHGDVYLRVTVRRCSVVL